MLTTARGTRSAFMLWTASSADRPRILGREGAARSWASNRDYSAGRSETATSTPIKAPAKKPVTAPLLPNRIAPVTVPVTVRIVMST